MGLTSDATGIHAFCASRKKDFSAETPIIALAGNPNVGKSTIFNALTGMNQHTGNWPGKTVSSASGLCTLEGRRCTLVDLPGTYSLLAHSAEEEIARDAICFGGADLTVVVCDATCLARNLNLVLQTLEITSNTIVCVNLIDEATRKGISLNLPLLSKRLGVPVVGCTARNAKSLRTLREVMADMLFHAESQSRDRCPAGCSCCSGCLPTDPTPLLYPQPVEAAIGKLQPVLLPLLHGRCSARWLSLRLLEEPLFSNLSLPEALKEELRNSQKLQDAKYNADALLCAAGLEGEQRKDTIVAALMEKAESLCAGAVFTDPHRRNTLDQKLDRALTSRLTGYPVMFLLLLLVFWITMEGANALSSMLSAGLFGIQDQLTALFMRLGAPDWLHGLLILGVYRVLAWVVSVMLPPMAIFFPLFTLLEDVGYLPRVAYNLDRPFQCCHACGKQALTLCMGFGCNAAGVVGCRIIDSPRERMLAILTNSFVPCNGRFPALIALITMFFIGRTGFGSSLLSALFLTAVILLSIGMTFAATKLLSVTLLRGMPSSFTLELPPYRKPQIGKVIVRSVFDRTLFVLGRAAAIAAPAGLILWVSANVTVNGISILSHCAAFLDPFARLMGLDGVILIAFILGFPANEIVFPIILMAYLAQGSLIELGDLAQMRQLLLDHGWTWLTAVNMLIFFLFHWPCSTTLLTIRKETGSWRWTALAAAFPTAVGIICCLLLTTLVRFFYPGM